MSEVKCSTCKGVGRLEFEQGQRRVPCVTCSGSGIDWRKTCDAQRLRADTAEAELARLEEEFDTGEHALITLKLKLDAVERRNASLVPLVSMAKELLSTISKHQTMAPKDWCESFRGEVSRRITDLAAALNQKSEGESQDDRLDDEALQRRHDDERREYFSDGE